MSDEPYDYDPGTPYDPPPRRRRRRPDHRRPNEHDDAWAAADDMADEFEDVDPASLAAGYDWEDRDRYGVDGDRRRRDQSSPHDPPRVDRRTDPRPGGGPREEGRPAPRRRDMGHYDNPNYHRDRARRHEHAEYYGPRDRRSAQRGERERYPRSRYPAQPLPPQKLKGKPKPGAGPFDSGVLAGIPTWQLMIIVALVIAAFLAVAFTCVLLLTVL